MYHSEEKDCYMNVLSSFRTVNFEINVIYITAKVCKHLFQILALDKYMLCFILYRQHYCW